MGVQNREASMAGRIVFLGLGAALMYLMDPQAGKKRRNDLVNQMQSAQRSVQRGKDMVVRDATNRMHGMIHETRRVIQGTTQRVEDGTLFDIDANGMKERLVGALGPWGKPHWSPA